MEVAHFFDKETYTLTYIVYDKLTKDAIIIDPVLDFDQASGLVKNESALTYVNYIKSHNLRLHFILETHAHADHLSSSQIMKKYFPHAKVAASKRIKIVQETFLQLFNLSHDELKDRDFDYFFSDNEVLAAGTLNVKCIPTPGHTPACTTFNIGDSIFTGDALFMPDYGTGRCDFPGGSAQKLYESIQRLYSLPDSTRVFVGHDYSPNGRSMEFETTIGESKRSNIQLKKETLEEQYVQMRTGRDKTLKAPKLLLPSLQINIVAGHLPLLEKNGKGYLKLPLIIEFKGL